MTCPNCETTMAVDNLESTWNLDSDSSNDYVVYYKCPKCSARTMKANPKYSSLWGGH